MNGYGIVLAVVVIIALSCIRGGMKGFLRMVLSCSSFFLTFVLVWALHPAVSSVLRNNTNIYDKIKDSCVVHIQKEVEKELSSKSLGETAENVASVGDGMLEKSWLSIIGKYAGGVGDKLDNIKKDSIAGFSDGVGSVLAELIIKIIIFVVTFIIVSVILSIVFVAADVVTKLPVIHTLNKTLGVLLGFVFGVIIVWILMLVAVIFYNTTNGSAVLDAVSINSVVAFLYNTNPLLVFFGG